MYADIDQILSEGTATVWAPRSKPPVDLWCDEHRMLPSEGIGASRGGRWDTSQGPYLREILRRSTDPEVEEISFQKSTQVGATELLFCFLLYCIVVLGESMLYVYPTAEKGQHVNKHRLIPAIKNCEPARKLLEMGGAKAATNKWIQMAGNLIWFGYTKSADSLRGDPVGKVLNDETDKFDHSEEDPIENGRSRQTTFDDRLMWNISTPMDDESGITEMVESSDVRWTYHTPCSKCGGFFELWEFDLIQWIGGLNIDPQVAAANCWLKCPCCSERINLDDHRWMVQHGIYISQNETIESDGTIIETLDADSRTLVDGYQMLSMIGSDAFRSTGVDLSDEQAGEQSEYGPESQRYGVRIVGDRSRGPRHGYRICTMQSLVSAKGIRGLVYDFVKAEGRPSPTWWRDRMGRSPNTKGDRMEISDIKLLATPVAQGGYTHGTCPPWAIALFGGIDHQIDCSKILVKAYGAEGKRSAIIWSEIIDRDESLKFTDVRERLLAIGGFPVVGSTRTMTPSFLVDTGFWTHEVYELLRWLHRRAPRSRFIACKGISDREHDAVPYHKSSVREGVAPNGQKYILPTELELVLVNGHYYKDKIARNMARLTEESVESLRSVCQTDEEFEAVLDSIAPLELPDLESWGDHESVIAELAAEEKVLVGSGSGRSGKDGRGRLRKEWRKRGTHRKNDFGDCHVYSDCAADRFEIFKWTQEMANTLIHKHENALVDKQAEPKRGYASEGLGIPSQIKKATRPSSSSSSAPKRSLEDRLHNGRI